MKNLPFDDFVKAHFSDYSPNVPGHIWENIAARRKSKPKGFWNILSGGNLLILSLILLIGGGTSYLLLSSGNNNSSAKNIPASQTVNTASEKNISEGKPTTLSDQSA